MKEIKILIFGESATGDNIIDRKPSLKSHYPKNQVEFNTWTYILNVASRVQKVDLINPWYKDRKL